MLRAVAICVLAGCAAAPADMSRLAALDVDPTLKHFLVSMFDSLETEVNELRSSKEELHNQTNLIVAELQHSKERFAALEVAYYGLLNTRPQQTQRCLSC